MDKNEGKPQRYINNDEIDFSAVKEKLHDLFGSLKNSLYYFVKLLIKRKGLISFFMIFGIALAAFLFYNTKPVYTTNLTITSNYLSNEYCADLINTLEDLSNEGNYQGLADKLKIGQETAKLIHNIEYNNFSDKYEKIEKDTVIIGIPFKIQADVYKNDILDTLQHALVNYLENNSYALKRKNIKKGTLEQLSKKMLSEIVQLDTLKVVLNKSISGPAKSTSGIVLGGDPIDPINTYREVLNLYQRELNTKEQMLLIDNIEVIEGFTKFLKPSQPKLFINLILGAIAGFAIGLIFALTQEAKTSKKLLTPIIREKIEA